MLKKFASSFVFIGHSATIPGSGLRTFLPRFHPPRIFSHHKTSPAPTCEFRRRRLFQTQMTVHPTVLIVYSFSDLWIVAKNFEGAQHYTTHRVINCYVPVRLFILLISCVDQTKFAWLIATQNGIGFRVTKRLLVVRNGYSESVYGRNYTRIKANFPPRMVRHFCTTETQVPTCFD